MSFDEFSLEDLLGETPAPVKGRKLPGPRPNVPRSTLTPAYHGDIASEPEGEIAFDEDFDWKNAPLPSQSDFLRPVGVTFLAVVRRTEPRHIHKLLAKCPIVGYGNYQGKKVAPLYDFMTAISYLVEPKIDILDWLTTQTSTTLPPHINKAFWDAMNSKQRWQQRAGELWHTSDVLEVLGEVAMLIKETSQLWIENLPGKADLTDAQYNALTNMVGALLDDLHSRLVEMPKRRRTTSSVHSLDDDLAHAEASMAERIAR